MVFRCTSGACSFVLRSSVLSLMSGFMKDGCKKTMPCHFLEKHRRKWLGMKYGDSVQRQKSVKIKPKNHWENRWNIRLKELPLYLVELIEVLQSMEYRNILYLTKS